MKISLEKNPREINELNRMDNKKVAKGCGRERIADGCQTDGKR